MGRAAIDRRLIVWASWMFWKYLANKLFRCFPVRSTTKVIERPAGTLSRMVSRLLCHGRRGDVLLIVEVDYEVNTPSDYLMEGSYT
jgi:hypothetical protein